MSAPSRLALPTLGRPRFWAANPRPFVRLRRTGAMLVAVAAAWSGLAVPAAASSPASSTYVAVVEHGDGDLAVPQFQVSSAQQMTHRLDDLAEDGTVVSIDVDRPVRALGSVDPYRTKQWALDATAFEASWPLTNGTGAVVAVLDTGVQADHEDLAGSVLSGWDAITDRPGGNTDPHGHGTHVAGASPPPPPATAKGLPAPPPGCERSRNSPVIG